MKLAFALYKFFPYGGLQRDMLAIAGHCVESGAHVTLYCAEWTGARPEQMDVVVLPTKGFSNHARNRDFSRRLQKVLQANPVDYVMGFNKMPGLNGYYAADTSFRAKVMQERVSLLRFLPRYRQFLQDEEAVFATGQHTRILALSQRSVDEYEQYYPGISQRCVILPPGIRLDRKAPRNAAELRMKFRQAHYLGEEDRLILMIGSGFRTKGVDRAIHALAALPEAVKRHARLMVIGEDNARPFQQQARSLGVEERVEFFAGRDDIPDFLQGADLLLHPAYRENTGTVLLEAVVAGLPVLTTEVCGYSHYIQQYECGRVLTEPFVQERLDHQLQHFLENDSLRAQCKQNALAFAEEGDIYSLHQRAAALIVKAALEQTGHNT
jgi:UDP-glucose:(heptosyl)LPS alpha-1,3-glucosyltransferase